MKKYDLFKVAVADEALMNIARVFSSGFINEGSEVTQLKHALEYKLKAKFLTLTNACTSAIVLALKCANVNPGDDVVTTAMTCVATNTPIVNAGANIVWADIDADTGMLTLDSIRSVVTSKTKAVIIVAWAGTPPPELDLIYGWCHDNNIKLILDAAHAFQAEFMNHPIHKFADYSCYSFQAIKHFTTGDGGAIVTNDENDYRRLNALKWFGLDRDTAKDAKGNWKGQQWDADILEAGYKFNMNNIEAAIGLANIEKIDEIIARHRRNANQFDLHFQYNKYITPTQKSFAKSSNWVYTVLINDLQEISRDLLVEKLNQKGVAAGLVHIPNSIYTAFDKFYKYLPNTDLFSRRQFSLPCGWWLEPEDISNIYKILEETILEITQ